MKTNRIAIFISASYLSRQYKEIPKQIMDNAIFFFGSNRKWVFPETEEEIKDSKKQPTNYLAFDPDFKNLILKKESEGRVIWLKPECNYRTVSQKLATIVNKNSGQKIRPLNLDVHYWKYSIEESCIPRFTRDMVVQNFERGQHGYFETMLLLAISDKTLVPILDWNKTAKNTLTNNSVYLNNAIKVDISPTNFGFYVARLCPAYHNTENQKNTTNNFLMFEIIFKKDCSSCKEILEYFFLEFMHHPAKKVKGLLSLEAAINHTCQSINTNIKKENEHICIILD